MLRFRIGLCTVLLGALACWSVSGALAQTKPPAANVRVATMSVTNFTPLIVARDKGFFTEENLNVAWTMIAQGAIAVEAVFGGSAEFGGSAILEPMIARGNGLDVMYAVPTSKIRPSAPDNSGLLVRTNDTIKTPKDLVGKTVSAGLVNSINYIHMQEWLQKNGVDPKSVKFLEIPIPQMPDALFQSRVDVVWAVEPFLTVMQKSGNAHVLAYPYLDNVPGMDITAFVAKESWLKANADVARRFKRAVDKATVYLMNAPKEERDDWVAKFSGVQPQMVAQMNLPFFTNEFNLPSFAANLDIAVRQKVVKPFDFNAMIWKP